MTILDKEIASIRLLAAQNVTATITARIEPQHTEVSALLRSGHTACRIDKAGVNLGWCLDQIGRELREDMDARVSLMLGRCATYRPLRDQETGDVIGDIIEPRGLCASVGKTLREALAKARLSIQEAER